MERLKIRGFLVIKEADLELRQFNVLIGEQATGKSIIAKLIYYFKEMFGQTFYESAKELKGKRELDDQLRKNFEKIFPRRYWGSAGFEIVYEAENVRISLSAVQSHENILRIEYDNALTALFNKVKRRVKSLEETNRTDELPMHHKSFMIHRETENCFLDSPQKVLFGVFTFIPASRTIFAFLQRNIFSFLAHEVSIDWFIKEFGSTYEIMKDFYSNSSPLKDFSTEFGEFNAIMEKIIQGRYTMEKGEDWIVKDSKRVKLSDASSGQQEALPMLLVLFMRSILFAKKNNKGFIIEEPEAHLFPHAQQLFIQLLSLIVNKFGQKLFLTTHSPFILTSLNNHILAYQARIAVKGASETEEINTIIPETQQLSFEQVSAWSVQRDGTLKDIRNPETMLLNADVIDAVTESIDQVTTQLLNLQYAED